MNHSIESSNEVCRGIIDGSVTIESDTEFENLFTVFPDEPSLHRAYADFLARKESFLAAADEYITAARSYLNLRMPFQAIISSLLGWRMLNPSQQEKQMFYSALRGKKPQRMPLQEFFAKMSTSELSTIAGALELNRFPRRSKVKGLGDEERDLYFVVHGTLQKTVYDRSKESGTLQKKAQTELRESDFFGEIYPFDKDQVSTSEVETITSAEVAKISKPYLKMICRVYPNIEHLLADLYKAQGASTSEVPCKMIRKESRDQVPTKVTIQVLQQKPQKSPFNLTGFTENISIGGACVLLGESYRNVPAKLIGKDVKVFMALPIMPVRLSISGTIIWSKNIALNGKTITALGIQFRDVSERNREVLRNYFHGSGEEERLIWSLWELLMKDQQVLP
jgi:CRP-like cAMP-binding protein